MLYAKYVNEDAGYIGDIQKCKKLLKLDDYYEVERVNVYRFSTEIYLSKFDGGFNSVNFEFYTKDENGNYIDVDIYHDPKYTTYRRARV